MSALPAISSRARRAGARALLRRLHAASLLLLVGVMACGAPQAQANDQSDCHSRKVERAIKGCTRIINAGRANRSDIANAYAARAGAHFDNDDLDAAGLDVEKALELNPREGLAWAWRGHIQNRRNDHKAAVESFDKAIAFTPRDSGAWEGRADAKLALSQLDGAMTDITRSLQLDPKGAGAYVTRARINIERRRLEPAFVDLERALKLDDKNVAGLYSRADANRIAGQLDKALADIDRALAIAKDDVGSLLLRALLKGDVGRPREGIGDVDRVLAKEPNHQDGHGIKALLALAMEDLDTALRHANRAIEVKDTQGHEIRGIVYLRMGETDQAISDLTAAINSKSDSGINALAARGQAHAARGQSSEAIADLEAVARLSHWYPRERRSHALAKQMLAELKGSTGTPKPTPTAAPAAPTTQGEITRQPASPRKADYADPLARGEELVAMPGTSAAGGWAALGNSEIGYCVVRQYLPNGLVEYWRLADGTTSWVWQDDRFAAAAGPSANVEITFDGLAGQTWRWRGQPRRRLVVNVPETWLMSTLPRFERITLRMGAASASYTYTGFSRGYAVLGRCSR